MPQTIIPATDWFFVHKSANEKEPPVVWNLAAWSQTENGEVIGLIGAFGHQQAAEKKTPHLVPVPPVPGAYLHRSQLSPLELDQSTKR